MAFIDGVGDALVENEMFEDVINSVFELVVIALLLMEFSTYPVVVEVILLFFAWLKVVYIQFQN